MYCMKGLLETSLMLNGQSPKIFENETSDYHKFEVWDRSFKPSPISSVAPSIRFIIILILPNSTICNFKHFTFVVSFQVLAILKLQ